MGPVGQYTMYRATYDVGNKCSVTQLFRFTVAFRAPHGAVPNFSVHELVVWHICPFDCDFGISGVGGIGKAEVFGAAKQRII